MKQSMVSAFALAAAIAFFHGAEYIERNKLDDPVKEQQFYPNWPKVSDFFLKFWSISTL